MAPCAWGLRAFGALLLVWAARGARPAESGDSVDEVSSLSGDGSTTTRIAQDEPLTITHFDKDGREAPGHVDQNEHHSNHGANHSGQAGHHSDHAEHSTKHPDHHDGRAEHAEHAEHHADRAAQHSGHAENHTEHPEHHVDQSEPHSGHAEPRHHSEHAEHHVDHVEHHVDHAEHLNQHTKHHNEHTKHHAEHPKDHVGHNESQGEHAEHHTKHAEHQPENHSEHHSGHAENHTKHHAEHRTEYHSEYRTENYTENYTEHHTRCNGAHQEHDCFWSGGGGVDHLFNKSIAFHHEEGCRCVHGYIVKSTKSREVTKAGDVCVPGSSHLDEHDPQTSYEAQVHEAWPSIEELSSAEVIDNLEDSSKEQIRYKGKVFVRKIIKRESDIPAVRLEVVANMIYEEMGVPSSLCRYYSDAAPNFALCRWITAGRLITPCRAVEVASKLQRAFVLDVLLQNYGLSRGARLGGNVALGGDGEPIRVNDGSALSVTSSGDFKYVHYRCRNRPLHERIKTWTMAPWSLWDFQAISIYQGITSEEIIKQTAKVIKKRKHLLSLFPDEYLDDKRHFEARINCLVRVVAHYVEHKNISLTVTAKELFEHPNKLPGNICTAVADICADIIHMTPHVEVKHVAK